MQKHWKRFHHVLALASAIGLLTACGGGGGSAAVAVTTDAVGVTVIDGAIGNALVCLDKNANGACDAGEPQGRTSASGKVTLTVDKSDTGKYPVLAMVGTDAVDADHGPVLTAFTLTAPADKTAVVSPLTTLVQHVVATTGASTTDAARIIADATGVTVSLFADFTQSDAQNDSQAVNPKTLARMLVVTAQQQGVALNAAVGQTLADNSTISRADVDLAIRGKLLERMPAMLTAMANPAVSSTDPVVREGAVQAAATTLVAASGLTVAALPTIVAINKQIAAGNTETRVASAGIGLANLDFTNASNYYKRVNSQTLAQDTPDANNRVRYQERRTRSSGGVLATWSGLHSSQPKRQNDLHWNGTAWINCGLNFESNSSVRDAQGNSNYNYCDNLETGNSNRATFDVSGQQMAAVYASIRAAGFSNLNIVGQSQTPQVGASAPMANASEPLGLAVFPEGSKISYQTGTMLTRAPAYEPAGVNSPVAVSNIINQYGPVVAAGDCSVPEANTNGIHSTTLEGFIASRRGTPCLGTGGSFVYDGVTYVNPSSRNDAWFAAAASMGTIGTAPVGSGPAPGFFTTNTKLRVAFTGSGANATTYYACKERFNTGSTRNCDPIGTGSYTITTMGDARVMSFNNLPVQFGALNYNQVYVERGGFVFYGYQSKLLPFSSARLNSIASTAMLTQLGLPVDNPSTSVALSAGSHQGVYDFRSATALPSAPGGMTLTLRADGSASCLDRDTQVSSICTVTITNPLTGAFTVTRGTVTITGTLNFVTGAGSGVFVDTNPPDMGNIVTDRR